MLKMFLKQSILFLVIIHLNVCSGSGNRKSVQADSSENQIFDTRPIFPSTEADNLKSYEIILSLYPSERRNFVGVAKKVRISINSPKAWELNNTVIYDKAGWKVGEIAPGLVPYKGNLESYLEDQKSRLFAETDPQSELYMKLESIKPFEFRGLKGYRLRAKARASDGQSLRQIYVNYFFMKIPDHIVDIYFFEYRLNELNFRDVEPILASLNVTVTE